MQSEAGMSLEKYQRKRDFTATPEPGPHVLRNKRGKLRFVVQKHAARRLHYDFRLEMDGVLKSWAVPKGPSLNPDDKRLAMEVEDHPMDYRRFEGIIPKGHYGGGTVMVWDEGTYTAIDPESKEPEKDLLAGLRKGHLSFVLQGEKLKGEFSLIRMRGRQENAWLLVKKRDDFADSKDVTLEDASVKSSRSMEEIAKKSTKKKDVWQSKPKTNQKLSPKKTFRKPKLKILSLNAGSNSLIKPMLATLVDEPFDRKNWIFEIKWDGYRAISEVNKKGVRIYSRNHNAFTEKYLPIAEELSSVPEEMILDGEIVVLDGEGRSSFQLLQNYNQTQEGNIAYFVFDILKYKKKDLTSLPLRERKKILHKVLPKLSRIQISEHIETKGEAFFKVSVEKGLEGIIAKDAESEYVQGRRSDSWLKIKTHLRQEAVICGYTEPKGSREKFGAVILGVRRKNKWIYVGHTGTGFDRETLKQVHSDLQSLIVKKCPFTPCPKTNAPATWVKPKIVCEVSFQEWTGDGVMRQPVFLGTRKDKSPSVVKHEVAKPALKLLQSEERKSDESSKAKSPHLTHLDKVYWPKEKITKGDLIEYYRKISDVILPYLKDRPQSLHRYPNGINGESFFQKNVEGEVPDWVKTTRVTSDNGKETEYLICQNQETLLYMANLGCIEINPWNSRIQKPESPDYLIIDLDPEAISFQKVIETAIEVRKVLESLDIESYCKTSGATGLHIYIPLEARYDYDASRSFAELLVNLIHRRIPGFTSVVRSPKLRQRKVYLDYLQNRQRQTVASAYSVRPRPGAPVSTPLLWSEVKKGLDPTDFNIKTIFKRLDSKGDLFAPVLKKGVKIEPILKRLQKENEDS